MEKSPRCALRQYQDNISELSIRDSDFRRNHFDLELISKPPEHEILYSNDIRDQIKENIENEYQEKQRPLIEKSAERQKVFSYQAMGNQRDLNILERKLVSNTKLEIQQIQEQMKLLTLNSLQNEIRQARKAVLEAEIEVRRMRIQARSFHKKTPSHQINEQYFPQKQLSKPFFHKKNNTCRKRRTYAKTEGEEGSSTTRSQPNELRPNEISLPCSFLQNNMSQRKSILKAKIQVMKEQIKQMKQTAQSKSFLLQKQINLLKEQRQTIIKSSSIVSSQISRINNSFMDNRQQLKIAKICLKFNKRLNQSQEVKNTYYLKSHKIQRLPEEEKRSNSEKDNGRQVCSLSSLIN